MKVTVITGSPHKNGTSALLANEFIRGAQDAGWEAFRFDAAFEQVAPAWAVTAAALAWLPASRKTPCRS